MDLSILKVVGQIAGIGGLALGIFFLLFRKLLEKVAGPTLKQAHWYKIILVFMVLVWSIGVLGVAAWLYVNSQTKSRAESDSSTAKRYAEEIYHSEFPAQVEQLLGRIQGEVQNANEAKREIYAVMLAQLIVHYERSNKWKDQVRSVRAKMLEMFKDYSAHEFYTYFQEKDFQEMDLADMNFAEAEIDSLSFADAFLINASFKECDLRNVSFERALLRGADFLGADLGAVDFRRSDWFLAEGIPDATLKRLASENRLSPCPRSLAELKQNHDEHYLRVVFDNLPPKFRSGIIAQWRHYLNVLGIEEMNSGAVPTDSESNVR